MYRNHLNSFAQYTKTSLLCVGLLLCWFQLPGECCSPPEGPVPPDTVERTVYYSDIVIYGTVVQHFKQPKSLPSLFTAEMDVSCIFKGGPMARSVNISDAGQNFGLCFSTELSVGKSYVVYLRKNGEFYTPSDADVEVSGSADPYLKNVTRVCDLNTRYPLGADPSLIDCPQTERDPNCVRYQEQAGPTNPADITAVPPLKEFTTPEEKKDNSNTVGGTGDLNQGKDGASSKGTEALVVAVLLGVLALIL